MPGTQPRGTHAFHPASSSSTKILDLVDTEEDGAEDQINLPLDSMATLPPLVPADLAAFSTSSIVSSLLSPDFGSSSSSSHTMPPPSSSLPPTVYPQPSQRRDISMGSTSLSITTGSDAGSSQFRKRKRREDARSTSGTQPPGPHSKRASTRTKTNDLNPIVITTALNSTLNRMVDVMERTLDATSVSTAAPSAIMKAPTTSTSPPAPSIFNSSIEPLAPQPLSASVSPAEILDQAIRIISGGNGMGRLTEDQLLSASLFFSSASDDAVRTARTFIALGNNQTVQYRFLLSQLATRSGKGKGKAVEDDSDDFMEA